MLSTLNHKISSVGPVFQKFKEVVNQGFIEFSSRQKIKCAKMFAEKKIIMSETAN